MIDEESLNALRAVVDAQAEDHGLWFEAEHATEAYLQGSLRYLHHLIESLPRTILPAVHECEDVIKLAIFATKIGEQVTFCHEQVNYD